LPRYSVLDQSIAATGRPQDAAIRDTLALAEQCDRLGYARFWMSEILSAALAHPYSASEQAWLEQCHRVSFVGTADEVAQRVEALAAHLKVQEVAIVTWTHDEAIRRRSYELLATAFDLT
jgi:alkanesulfonate monooxygenase SsuD/methylene tetrahydromethanopterin reductase-like flavin-dependent oxidoreductase (luciferase family)